MTRTCYLHIGMHKTGSSAIQQSLEGFDDGQTSYCDFGHPNHSGPLSILFMDDPKSLYATRRQAKNEKATNVIKARHSHALGVELEKSTNTILSAEGLTTNLSHKGIERLLTFLKPHYSDIQVIAYIRPILPFTISAFQQRLKTVSSGPLALPRPNYRKRFRPWVNLLGENKISFTKYDPSQLVNNDIVEDFCNRVSIDVSDTKQVTANKSMSAEAAAILYCHNRNNNPPNLDRKSVRAHRLLVERVQSIGSSRFSFSPSLFEDLLEKESEDIDWMEKQAKFLLRDFVKETEIVFSSEDDIIALANEQSPKLIALLSEDLDSSGNVQFGNLSITNAMASLYMPYARRNGEKMRGKRNKA